MTQLRPRLRSGRQSSHETLEENGAHFDQAREIKYRGGATGGRVVCLWPNGRVLKGCLHREIGVPSTDAYRADRNKRHQTADLLSPFMGRELEALRRVGRAVTWVRCAR